MISEAKYSKGLVDLRSFLAQFKPGQKVYDETVASRQEVFAKYQPIFSQAHIPSLTKEEFASFLYIENNRHWTGLYRHGLGAADNIQKLRASLAVLLDENKPIRERFPESLDMVSGFGKALATAILTVSYPERYGVWNNTSETGLRQVGLWPSFEKGEGVGGRYEKINGLLLRIASDIGIDLWTLDALWWFVLEPGRLAEAPSGTITQADQRGDSFALERQLEEFLLENWEQTPLAKDWSIFESPDDPEAGNQFPTDVGPIDILAVDKTQRRFLVIELKRNQSTHETVGQALKYVGWVKKHLAKDGQDVEALIIAHKAEKDIQYALSTVTNVRMMTYELEFRLKGIEPLPE
jgi:hypothetical protein